LIFYINLFNKNFQIIKILKTFFQKANSSNFYFCVWSFLEESYQDIDIGIFINEKKVNFSFEFWIELPYRFSIEIIKGERLILTKDEARRVEFETMTFSHYLDFQPVRDQYLRDILNIENK